MLPGENSDSEDDLQIKEFLEAADTTLLNNSMFKDEKVIAKPDLKPAEEAASESIENQIKSQRYLYETDNEDDFLGTISANVKNHVAKKLAEILKSKYEFYDSINEVKSKKRKRRIKDCVKLVNDADCYVNSCEEFGYDNRGPQKKPEIKKRIIDEECELKPNKVDLKTLAVDSETILRGNDMKHWAAKKERIDKIFRYKSNSKGVLHAIDVPNEFTSLRLHNNWNESKIKSMKKYLLHDLNNLYCDLGFTVS